MPEEIRKKISQTLKGKIPKNLSLIQGWNKGKKLSKEHCENLKQSHIGHKATIKTRIKMSKRMRGERNPFWKGGRMAKYPEREIIRKSLEYALWRKSVFERDNYACRFCGRKGGELNADHIKPFCDYPELRFAIDNGRTLCENCHRKTNTYGGRIKCLKQTN